MSESLRESVSVVLAALAWIWSGFLFWRVLWPDANSYWLFPVAVTVMFTSMGIGAGAYALCQRLLPRHSEGAK